MWLCLMSIGLGLIADHSFRLYDFHHMGFGNNLFSQNLPILPILVTYAAPTLHQKRIYLQQYNQIQSSNLHNTHHLATPIDHNGPQTARPRILRVSRLAQIHRRAHGRPKRIRLATTHKILLASRLAHFHPRILAHAARQIVLRKSRIQERTLQAT